MRVDRILLIDLYLLRLAATSNLTPIIHHILHFLFIHKLPIPLPNAFILFLKQFIPRRCIRPLITIVKVSSLIVHVPFKEVLRNLRILTSVKMLDIMHLSHYAFGLAFEVFVLFFLLEVGLKVGPVNDAIVLFMNLYMVIDS